MTTPARTPSKDPSLVPPDSSATPIPVVPGATHFRLKRNTRTGEDCTWANEQGVLVDHHPISEFGTHDITARWGFGTFHVQFFRESTPPGNWKPLGGYRKIGLMEESADGRPAPVDPATGQLVPYGYRQPPAEKEGGMEAALGMLMSLKEIARADTTLAVETVRASHQAELESTRTFMTTITQMMMMQAQLQQKAAVPAADPAMMALLTRMDQRMSAMEEALDDDDGEDEETEEEETARKHKALLKRVRDGGAGELLSYAKETATDQLIEQLPELKKLFPVIFRTFLEPWLKAKLAELQAPRLVPAAPSPPPRPVYAPPPPQPSPFSHSPYAPPTTLAPAPAAAQTNGTPVVEPEGPATDEHTESFA